MHPFESPNTIPHAVLLETKFRIRGRAMSVKQISMIISRISRAEIKRIVLYKFFASVYSAFTDEV